MPPAEPPPDPALIFETGHAGPGTHVLLVGIGSYTCLVDGEEENLDIADGMGQLSAPPRSVKALADWFLGDEFVNPDHPLASLSLVVSADEPWDYQHPKRNRGVGAVPRGDAADVVAAIRKWLDRASQHPDCNSIFYFCGHGIFSGNMVLLCRDYGSVAEDRFEGALNFTNFVGAMETKKPNRQLFIADACRTPDATIDLLGSLQGAGRSPLTYSSLVERGGGVAALSVHFASSMLEPSYGRTDGISICTDALLRALAGGGGQTEDDLWVGTNGLHDALSTYVPRLARAAGVIQEPDRIRARNFRITKPGRVAIPIYFSCNPAEAWQSPFSLGAERVGRAGAIVHQHDPAQDPGRVEVEIPLECGEYRFDAEFAEDAPFASGTRDGVLVGPPGVSLCLDIQRRQG